MPAAGAAVLARAAGIEERVRTLVDYRRAGDPAPDDPFRGLYLTEDAVDRLLARRLAEANTVAPRQPAATPEEPATPLHRLIARAELTDLDVDLLLVALLPDLDARFEKLYGYLNDDVTRRRASVGLALELAGGSPVAAAHRRRLSWGAPLVDRSLLLVEDSERPFLTRSLRVPDRVARHLLGDDGLDPTLIDFAVSIPAYEAPLAVALRLSFASGISLAYLREQAGGLAAPLAVAALAGSGQPALCLDLTRLAADADPDGLVATAGRESLMRGGGLVAGPVEALAESCAPALRRLTRLGVPVVLVGAGTWDPTWSDAVPLLADAPSLGPTERTLLWAQRLGDAAEDAVAGTAHFVLGPVQVGRAVLAAEAAARLHGGALTSADLHRGARAQNAAGLERLARRIEPEVSWSDLVLPDAVQRQLREVTARARHRDRVLSQWRMRRGGGRGRGVMALFAGDSGTGKTMSAEVIAGDLGLDLYTVNLATVVDKYVGETEKNLERIFAEASGVNAVLLFDEADAIFGKRSEVRDAHDRYANIESAYLLQRMETFDGLAILATNLRANIDDAFTRRLDAIVDFVAPNDTLRLALWERCLAAPLPHANDLDLAFVARAFELSGGNIRSAATTAAYLAADADSAVGMGHLIAAVQQEYRKLGRLVHEREFGHYLTPGR
jgi:ATPase family associated with various cellular activities (AAA)